MFLSEEAIFLPRKKGSWHQEFLIEKDFYLAILVKETGEKEKIKSMLEKVKYRVRNEQVKNLLTFQTIINQEIKEKLKEQSFSLVTGLVVGDVFYLLTYGEGEIYLKREGKIERIISKNNSASGYLKNNDFFILTFNHFFNFFNKESFNQKLIQLTPKEAVEIINLESEEITMPAIFLRFFAEKEKEKYIEEKSRFFENYQIGFFKQIKDNVFRSTPSGKKITFSIAIFLLFLLLWSVVFGYQRRAYYKLMNKVKVYQEKIEEKLNEATDLATINLDRSLTLLSEAKKELKELNKIVGRKKIKEIDRLEKLILTKEKEIIKKEEKSGEEFYDLKLIAKNARGTKIYLDNQIIAVLNSADGEIYLISLITKSNKTIKANDIKGADLVSLYNEVVFFFNKEKGIYKVNEDGKIKLAVKKDDNWGEVVDFWIYNGNLYLLDKSKDEVYKYLVAEGGYSEKTSYFKSGQAIDLSTVTSMAIDASIYLATNKEVYKYTAGVREDFQIDFPEKEGRMFNKIYTDKNCNKIYLWEKEKGRISILSKNGRYERQINSNLLNQALDFVVLEKMGIFVLVKEKVYKIGWE